MVTYCAFRQGGNWMFFRISTKKFGGNNDLIITIRMIKIAVVYTTIGIYFRSYPH
jgi:hypothetical protein